MHAPIPGDREHPDQQVQQQIRNLVQVGGDHNAKVLVDVMIFDGTQLLHFKAILGMTDCGSGLLK
jgi:hypothetical protein